VIRDQEDQEQATGDTAGAQEAEEAAAAPDGVPAPAARNRVPSGKGKRNGTGKTGGTGSGKPAGAGRGARTGASRFDPAPGPSD